MSVIEDLTAFQPVPPKSVGQVLTGGIETSRTTWNGHTGRPIKTRLAPSHVLESWRVTSSSSITGALTWPVRVRFATSASKQCSWSNLTRSRRNLVEMQRGRSVEDRQAA